ncbi:hypothetical protein [Streptomyces sp. NPDC018000]|uniref:hypothetical protein n=1 Tax=Streptomyces sp. NPDC018000 TaxID=3365028 RepID=UPI0037B979B4
MGLMSWLRVGGRTGTGTGKAAGAESGSGSAAPAAEPRERVDVAELPPIQRSVGTPDLVIDPSGFEGSLSTRQDASLGTPLGHLVSPDAPTGLVHGITAPAVPVTVDRPSPVQRTVKRSVERPVGARSVPLPVSLSVPLPVPLSVPLAVPMQRVVSGDAPAMTSAGEPAVAELPVRRLVGEQPFAPASAPEPTSESAAPGPPPPTPSPPVQRSVLPPAADRTRRVPGLGAPMPALPPTAQRLPAADGPDGQDAAESGVMPVARSVADGGTGESPEAARVPAAPEPAPDSDGPTAPLLGDSPLVPAASESTSAAPTSAAPTQAVQRTPTVPAQAPLAPPPASEPVAPLLAGRPLTLQSGQSGAAGAVQRSAVDGAAAAASAGTGSVPGPVPPSLPDAVPVRWTSAGSGAPSAAVTPSVSVPAVLQRVATSPGQAAGTPSPSLPALQRQAVGGPPVPRSFPGSGSSTAPASPSAPPSMSTSASPSVPSAPSGPAAPSFTSAGSVAVASGVAQRMADGSVVFGAPPPSYAPPVVQRETETEEPPPPDPPQEAAPEPDPEPQPEPRPAAEGRGAPGAPGHGAAPGGAPVVTDELVRALYPPLSRLFKADLRLERERAGFLINTRH